MRARALLTLAALTTLVAGATVAPVSASPRSPATAPGIDWRPCVPADPEGEVPVDPRRDIRCADVRVPVDHADPEGRSITVAVTLVPATGDRAGVVFGNPGGPGIDARGMWADAVDRWYDTAVDELNRTHDLVAVQPRGLAGAGEMTCPDSSPQLPYTARAWDCHEADPQFVGSLTTGNVVRDTDLVRGLMGVETISFIGYSYGTAVGMAYQALFPERLDRLVLDSAVGPSTMWWKRSEAIVAEHRQPARDAFLAWIARHHEVYGLGATAGQVYDRLRAHDQLAGDESRRFLPPPGPPGSSAGSSDLAREAGVRLDDAVGAAGGRFSGPSQVGESAFTVLDRNSGFPSLWPAEADRLAWMLDPGRGQVSARGTEGDVPDGDVPDGGRDGDAPEGDFDDDDVVTTADRDTYIGILRCAENTVPPEPGVEPALDLARGLGSSDDTIDHLRHRALACPFPAASTPPPTVANPLAAPPLVLQSDGDPFTPAPLGAATAERTGGVLVRVRGVQHALFGFGNPEVDRVVLHYLRTGESPRGAHLSAAPEPVPW